MDEGSPLDGAIRRPVASMSLLEERSWRAKPLLKGPHGTLMDPACGAVDLEVDRRVRKEPAGSCRLQSLAGTSPMRSKLSLEPIDPRTVSGHRRGLAGQDRTLNARSLRCGIDPTLCSTFHNCSSSELSLSWQQNSAEKVWAINPRSSDIRSRTRGCIVQCRRTSWLGVPEEIRTHPGTHATGPVPPPGPLIPEN
jgi:hypothetical protein